MTMLNAVSSIVASISIKKRKQRGEKKRCNSKRSVLVNKSSDNFHESRPTTRLDQRIYPILANNRMTINASKVRVEEKACFVESRPWSCRENTRRVWRPRGDTFFSEEEDLAICRQLWERREARRGTACRNAGYWFEYRKRETEGGRRRTTTALIKTAVSLEVPLRVVSKWKSKYRRARRDSPLWPSLFSLSGLRLFSLVVDETTPFSVLLHHPRPATSNPRVKIDLADRSWWSQPSYSSFVKLESSLQADIGSERADWFRSIGDNSRSSYGTYIRRTSRDVHRGVVVMRWVDWAASMFGKVLRF